MKNSKLIYWSVIDSVGAFAYILWVAWLMFNANSIFGKMNSFLGPAALLLLFVLSATIVGALVLGRPIYLYLGGSKAEAIKLLAYTIVALFLITLVMFFVFTLIR